MALLALFSMRIDLVAFTGLLTAYQIAKINNHRSTRAVRDQPDNGRVGTGRIHDPSSCSIANAYRIICAVRS